MVDEISHFKANQSVRSTIIICSASGDAVFQTCNRFHDGVSSSLGQQ